MNLSFPLDRKKVSKYVVAILFLTTLQLALSPIPKASAVQAPSLTSNTQEAQCASTVADTASAKLDVIVDGNYCVLRFLSGSDTWTPPTEISSYEYLVVGGGGGGGGERAGGGGAGGVVTGTNSVSGSSPVSISVGNGGNGGGTSQANNTEKAAKTGETGTASTLGNSIIAYGGGGGSGSFSCCGGQSGRDGGSGGGAGIWNDDGAGWTFSSPNGYAGGLAIPSGQGNNGGGSGPGYGLLPTTNPCNYTFDTIRNPGGGGGAGGAGLPGQGGTRTGSGTAPCDTATTVSGVTLQKPNGGIGIQSSITGAKSYYAGGGGGTGLTSEATYFSAGSGSGGLGGGGNASATTSVPGNAGTPNTGGGGGAGALGQRGGAGGSGIVIIRFLASNFNNDYTACSTGLSPTSIYADSRTITSVAGDCLIFLGAEDEYNAAAYSWQVPQGVLFAQVLIVGGGGGGGNWLGGGGGGGQVLDSSTVPVRVNPGETYTLTVGIGGDHKSGYRNNSSNANGGTKGQSSSMTGTGVSLTALGGGGAAGSGSSSDKVSDLTGWTGGGCGGYNQDGSCTWDPVGGSTRKGGGTFNVAVGAGGGGDGGPGGQAGKSSTGGGYGYYDYGGGVGGLGTSVRITGVSRCLGGGGSGGSTYDTSTSSYNNWRPLAVCGGGTGSRGPLSNLNPGVQSTAATPGTGGGGGGAGVYQDPTGGLPYDNATAAEGGHGGSGIIIIRFTPPNPRGATRNLNMACHAFSSTTSTEQSRTAGYFGSAFTTDTTTSEMTFDSVGYNSAIGHQWSTSGPTGCGTSGDYYTVYAWGYIQNPIGTLKDIYFGVGVDDGFRLVVDGKVFIDQTTSSGGGSWTYTNNITDYITMKPGSWHFIQMWKHELTGSSAIELRAKYAGGSYNSISMSYMSRYAPRTISSSVIPASTRYNETLTVSMTVDTSTEVIGGVNDSSTVMSMKGKFTFYDSGTALSGCTDVYSTNGTFKCSWYVKPAAIGWRWIKVLFTPDTSTASTDLQYNVFRRVEYTQNIEIKKGRQSPLQIGQYTAFIGVSTYPLNVYPDTRIYPKVGDTITRSVTRGTAGCQLDVTGFFVTDTLTSTSNGGNCVATAVLSGTSLFDIETGTATIYWVKWTDAFATQVLSGAHTIPLSGGTQIISHTETVTVTDTATTFRDLSDGAITSAAPGAEIRIYITGYAGLTAADLSVTFRVYEDATITAKTDTYVQVVVPMTASSGVVAIDSPRGVAYTPSLTISP